VGYQENYKEFLKYMHKLYDEELINQDAYVIDPTELQSISADDRIGYHAFNSLLGKGTITDPYEYYGVVGMTSEYNEDTSIVIEASTQDTYRLVANAETEHPEEIAKFVDYLLTDEGVLSAVNGYEGLSFEFKEVAGYQVTDLTNFAAEAGLDTETFRTTVALGRGAFSMGAIARGTIFDMLANIELDQILEEDCWGPSTVNALKVLSYRENPDIVIMDRFPSLTYTAEELKEYSILYTDINNYLKTAKAQFITGEMDIDASWDAHIEKLNEMGLERLLEIESAAYTRYLAK
jgi:putative aldouronate transport system substrate-binding protein